MKTQITLLLAFVAVQFSLAQESNNILLTIDDHPVTKDEFLRIYNKNNSIAEDQHKSVDDYLDLFINYKLKVIEAENLGYDTMSSFINEMAGYTKQLAKPYIENKEVYDSFAMVEYQRSLEEINASQLLLRLDKNALPKDTLTVYNNIMKLREKLIKGEPWEKVIKDNSPDPENKIGGDLGWFSAFRMMYPFETVAYNTPVGQISMPVRTDYGYHLIRVNNRRPSRGEVYLAHIMTILPKNPTDEQVAAAKQKIQQAYDELQNGADWAETVKKYSEHKATINDAGSLGWLKVGTVPDEMLDVGFALDSGQYSKPIRTKYGFHIIKSYGVKSSPSYEKIHAEYLQDAKLNPSIQNLVKKMDLQKIEAECGYKFFESSLDTIYAMADSSMRNGHWNADNAKDLTDPVFIIDGKVYTQYDVAKAVCTKRFLNHHVTLPMAIRMKLMDYIDEQLHTCQIDKLPSKYADLKNLLDEYHDGILLFNLTEDKVWKKAVDDSAGLQKFYDGLPEKYVWDTRLALTKYTYKDSTLTSALLKLAKKRAKAGTSASAMSKTLCPNDTVLCVSFIELKYEKGDNSVADSMNWEKGSYIITRDKENIVLYYADAVLPKQTKTLKDARGLYTADYQTYMEKQWIQELRQKYAIHINENVLDQIRAEESVKNKQGT
jgi:peptidyl-prolyl cis-trans isomerase SurA